MGTKQTAQDKLRYLNSIIMKSVNDGYVLNHAETCFQFCITFGSTKRYFEELLQQFIDRKLIIVEKGEILPISNVE